MSEISQPPFGTWHAKPVEGFPGRWGVFAPPKEDGSDYAPIACEAEKEVAEYAVMSANSHGDLLRTLREIARRAEDETLGIQADRLVAIANQAHAAIKKAEATTREKVR